MIALTVLHKKEDTPLSPFFARTAWLLFVEEDSGCLTWVKNTQLKAAFLIKQIYTAQPDYAICGHVDTGSARELLSYGVDLRFGPCSVPARSLIANVQSLPTICP
jgi:predicted Fe-Mo cluster-binding NifX family protein